MFGSSDKGWLGFSAGSPEESPGLRMNPDGTEADLASSGLGTFSGFDSRDSAALPGLHNYKPPQEEAPGFRMTATAPGADASTVPTDTYSDIGSNGLAAFGQGNGTSWAYGDGSLPYSTRDYGYLDGSGGNSMPAPRPIGSTATPSPYVPVRWSSDASTAPPRALPVSAGAKMPIWNDVRDSAAWLGERANAVVNGAYSIFPGAYNAARAVGRGVRLLGPDEYHRFDQEANFVGGALNEAVQHPQIAKQAAGDALSEMDKDPLFRYYMAGRMLMGLTTGLGPAAAAGDALHAVENGHDWIDAIRQGIQGTRPVDH